LRRPIETTSTIGTFTLSFGSYGGDRTGAVLLSPLLKPGSVSQIPFNHYSLPRTIEDIFDTDEHSATPASPGCRASSAASYLISASKAKAARAFRDNHSLNEIPAKPIPWSRVCAVRGFLAGSSPLPSSQYPILGLRKR
jgi:hypothetical protein